MMRKDEMKGGMKSGKPVLSTHALCAEVSHAHKSLASNTGQMQQRGLGLRCDNQEETGAAWLQITKASL